MIEHLSGTIIARKDNTMIIDVCGVGYGVRVSTYTLGKTIANTEIAFYIYTHVREQEIALYGFVTPEEQELFEALLTINGVGPKAAMNILSIADPQTILTAIAQEDASLLIKVSGIGKKTSERIVLELSGKVQNLIAAFPLDDNLNATIDTDAIDALVGLGYSVVEARDALGDTSAALPEGATMSDRIKAALRFMGKKR